MRLSQKLSLAAMGVAFLTALAGAVAAHLLGRTLIQRGWEGRFNDFAEALVHPLSSAVAERDLVFLDAYTFDLQSRPTLYVQEITVVDGDDAVLATASTSPPDEEEAAAGSSRIVTPLTWNGDPVGEMRIAFSNEPIAQTLDALDRALMLIALVGSLLGVAVSVLLARRLLSPLAQLTGQIERIRRREAATLMPLPPGDEIAEMTNAFLDLYEDLRAGEEKDRATMAELERTTKQLADELTLNAQLRIRLEEENLTLRTQVEGTLPAEGVIGADGDLAPTIEQAGRASSSRLPILLTGESGTGKEVLAHWIHRSSPRAASRFVTVNCGAIPEQLIESELFGHEKGSFTGAGEARAGKFGLAHGGTIFLDEIGELPLHMQPALLRVLESGQVDRVGAAQSIMVDVQVIAATNRDLAKEVAAGRFREDLYYRLRGIHIRTPSLRERPRDLVVLSEKFLADTASDMGTAPPVLAPSAVELLRKYRWPGNIRELRYVLAAALTQHPVTVLEAGHLSPLLAEGLKLPGRDGADATAQVDGHDFDLLVNSYERRLLEDAMRRCASQKEIAAHLELTEARLHRLLKRHNLLGWKVERPKAGNGG